MAGCSVCCPPDPDIPWPEEVQLPLAVHATAAMQQGGCRRPALFGQG